MDVWLPRCCLVLVTWLALLSDTGRAAEARPGQVSDVEEFLAERRRENGAPGLSYALVHDDRIVASGAWGVDGHGRPMSEHTPVGFGSVSKPLTATAVLRLVDAGTVALTDPVIHHLPWFRLADQNHAEHITVRQLIEQTSGISGPDGYARSDRNDNAPGAIRRWVESLADVTPTAAPGERHQYSPANATILAALIEEVTGLSFGDFMAREVFAPLDMTDTIVNVQDAERMPPGHEYYFGTVRVADRTFDTSGLAYGYLAGSVTDLAHLAIPLINEGRHGSTQFLSEGTGTAFEHGGPPAAGGRYPLGWRTSTLKTTSTTIVWHAGAVTGYHTVLITAPDAGWAIAIQQNAYSPLRDEALNSAAFGALTIVLGGTPSPAPGNSTEVIALAALGTVALVLLGGLAWSIRRLLVRRASRPRTWRDWLAAAVWSGLGILSASAVGLVLPGMFGVQLRHIVRFMPDLGQLAIAILLLGPTLTVTRVAILLMRARTIPDSAGR